MRENRTSGLTRGNGGSGVTDIACHSLLYRFNTPIFPLIPVRAVTEAPSIFSTRGGTAR